MTRLTGAILAAAFVLGGCSALSGPDVDIKGDWSLVLTGSGGCNQYGGPIQVHGSDVTLGEIFQTEMACLGDGSDEAERTYMDALRRMNRAACDGGTLTLSGPSVALHFHLS